MGSLGDGLDYLCLCFSAVYATFYDRKIHLKNEDTNLFSGFNLAWSLITKHLFENPGYFIGNPWVANCLEMSPAWRSHALSRYHLMSSFLNFQYPLFSCPWFQTQPKSSLYLINVSQGWAIWGRSKGTGAQRLASQAHLSVPSVLRLAVLFRYVISNPCCHPSFLLFVLGVLVLSFLFSAVSSWASQMVRTRGLLLGPSDGPTPQ